MSSGVNPKSFLQLSSRASDLCINGHALDPFRKNMKFVQFHLPLGFLSRLIVFSGQCVHEFDNWREAMLMTLSSVLHFIRKKSHHTALGLGGDYMANFISGWNSSPLPGLKFCCDYMASFSPGRNFVAVT